MLNMLEIHYERTGRVAYNLLTMSTLRGIYVVQVLF
jgi:hypothetical protein